MRSIPLVLVLVAACAHTGGSGADPEARSAAELASLPQVCGEALGVADAPILLSYEERSDLALLDAACLTYAREGQGARSARCSEEKLGAVVEARGKAVIQARNAASARLVGDVGQATEASASIRSLRLSVQALSTSACGG